MKKMNGWNVNKIIIISSSNSIVLSMSTRSTVQYYTLQYYTCDDDIGCRFI